MGRPNGWLATFAWGGFRGHTVPDELDRGKQNRKERPKLAAIAHLSASLLPL